MPVILTLDDYERWPDAKSDKDPADLIHTYPFNYSNYHRITFHASGVMAPACRVLQQYGGTGRCGADGAAANFHPSPWRIKSRASAIC